MLQPNETDLLGAIQGVWLRMRYAVGPTRFMAYLRGREKACILSAFGELERIWQAYSTSLATADSRAGAANTARKYRDWLNAVRDMALSASVIAYDPTLKGDVGVGDDAIPGVIDPLYFWDTADAYRSLTDTTLHAKLCAAGWQLPRPLETPTPEHAP